MDMYFQQNSHFGVLKVSVYLEINSNQLYSKVSQYKFDGILAYLKELDQYQVFLT